MAVGRARFTAGKVAAGFLLLCILFSGRAGAGPQNAPQEKRANPALAPVQDVPHLPRVLLIGDSISIAYTIPVRDRLKKRANVHRIPENGETTTKGLANIEEWLGEGKWDVIHFNWGLHDLKILGGVNQVPLPQYEANLRKLVKRLARTRAKLIWCSTTPVPPGVTPPRRNEDVLKYNAAARRIARENGVAVDDLYALARGRLGEIQKPGDVHFTPQGSKVLAAKVSQSILEALVPQE